MLLFGIDLFSPCFDMESHLQELKMLYDRGIVEALPHLHCRAEQIL